MPAIPIIMVVAAVVGAGMAIKGNIDARNAAADAAAQQRQTQGEQQAVNSAAAAAELRNQIRQERVKRATILQASSNSGTAGSSGEFGAIDSLSTQLESNIGSNQGALMSARNIGFFGQNSADFMTSAQRASNSAQLGGTIFNTSTSIFSNYNKNNPSSSGTVTPQNNLGSGSNSEFPNSAF